MSAVVETNMLDSRYRCDRCNSQAYVLAVLDWYPGMGEGELYLCGHHWAQHAEALEPICSLIVDEKTPAPRSRQRRPALITIAGKT